MLGTTFGPFLYMSVVILAGGFFGYFLIRRGRKRGLVMLMIAHVLTAIGLYGAAQAANPPGMAMTYVLFLFLLVLPSLVGVVLGAALGWWRGPRVVQDEPQGRA